MIQSENFDFEKMHTKFSKVDKKIDFKSKNMKTLKSLSFGFVYVGLFIFIFLFICGLIGVLINISKSSNIIMDILKLFLVTFAIGTILSMIFINFNFIGKANLSVYRKLKKISKKEYEVYKYTTNIDAFYNSTSIEYKSNSSSNFHSGVAFQKRYIRSNGNILLIDNQKIYVDNSIYDEIKYDKQINLYFIKYENEYILFNYERVMENK